MELIDTKQIYTVYQPIVFLTDGTILGYEALTRIAMEDCSFHIEEAFKIAEELDKVWELEAL